MKIKINLIPGYKREEIKKNRSFRFVLKQGVEMLILILFLAASVFSFQLILKMEYRLAEDSLNYDSKKGEFEKIENYDKNFEEANNLLGDLEKIQKNQLHWSLLLEKVSSLVPSGIVLNGITTKNYQVIISGEATERSILIDFKEKLEQEECFENIDLPLSNLVSRNNIDFQMEFDLKDNCLKEK